ncbi:MAG: ABC transporter permease [Planctomycetota bacterium]
MKYTVFLARKYLFSRFITWAAVIAVAFGVFALISVLSVMEGFKVKMVSHIRGSLAHLTVTGHGYASLYQQYELAEAVGQLPHVLAVAPFVEQAAIFKASQLRHCSVRGVDPLLEAKVGDFASYLLRDDEVALRVLDNSDTFAADRKPLSDAEIEDLFSRERRLRAARSAGVSELELETNLPQPIVVGIEAIRTHSAAIGQILQLSSYSPISLEPCSQNFVVVGAFQSGIYEQDASWMFTPIRAAQEFLALYDDRPEINEYRFSGLAIRLDDYTFADAVSADIYRVATEFLGLSSVVVLTWEDQRRHLLDAVVNEKSIISLMMMLIVAFAGAMIFLLLTLLVIEKTRDLGVLRSLGATSQGVVSVILIVGLTLVLCGIALGGLAGWLFVTNINEIHDVFHQLTGRQLFPPNIYYLSSIPVAFKPWDLGLIIGSAYLFGFLGSLVPAIWASRVDPIKALRHE